MFDWFNASRHCVKTYGSALDREERFFVCPECGEPIYEDDWEDHDDWEVCPVCGFDFIRGE